MYALLAVCLSLCPQTKLVDESVNSQLREKYGEKMMRMQRFDMRLLVFMMSSSLMRAPSLSPLLHQVLRSLLSITISGISQDAYRLQLKMFLYEVKQHQLLSGVRTFLKVYSSISLGKLANYMEVDEPTLRRGTMTILLTYKYKTHSVGSDGKIISNADIDFDINDDMMDVVETKPTKQYGDFFLRQIAKLEGVINDMDRIKLE
ncbi:hypothetical protein F2Q70_00018683 [Brassica cretica]|uniref:PCI domain-containing protein n=1 Tax=Brassica cretica TaxID=69181 RepID=A0A8S9I382_BRACR|nr:hypothetical protein F2Q70_00018683 [Brassica cretica]